MEIKEKIRKVYQKYGMEVSDGMVEYIENTPERLNGIIRLYKQEETESMNYILGKPKDNKIFTEFELETMNKIDLFDRKVVNICKIIWDNKDNTEKLEKFMKILDERGCSKCI